MGFTDRQCRLCFAPTLWNGKDKILKERLFGVTGTEGNHGEDVKELYYYVDSTPTHSYCHGIYKYPINEYPYEQLLEGNKNASKTDPEFEVLDTGVFHNSAYYDMSVEYAKETPDSICIRITLSNRSEEKKEGEILHFLPTLWFRNTWSWGDVGEGATRKPLLWLDKDMILLKHDTLEQDWQFTAEKKPEQWLFTDNESNFQALGFETPEGHTKYTKDAFHRYVVNKEEGAISPDPRGTKVTPYYKLSIEAGKSETFHFRLRRASAKGSADFGDAIKKVFDDRIKDANEFYEHVIPSTLNEEEVRVSRQAYAGLCFGKQFYHYVVRDWVKGDPKMGREPVRGHERNGDWGHFHARDVISMPDKWEYPWFAVWDLAFHMVAMVTIDPYFAKDQLLLFLREWYMHPSGMIPAYEWDFNSVNPPVHAWACWRVYRMTGSTDKLFLERVFTKLLINFTWWVNRKDASGSNIFTGGFLGLDNISIFDRSEVGTLEQADATSWMAFFCSYMLSMALELAQTNLAMEDIASKFFEHFISIVDAINTFGGTGLWDEQDHFFYDCYMRDGQRHPLRIRSVVGLIPLAGISILEKKKIEKLPGFKKRFDWFRKHRPWIAHHIEENETSYLLSVVKSEKLRHVIEYVVDPNEFLSPYGIRSLSRYHKDHPFTLEGTNEAPVSYIPGESDSYMFGGNSNWRGPIWFPINSLIIEAIRKYHHFLGEDFQVEYPARSGALCTLQDIAEDLAIRTASIFIPRHSDEEVEGYEDIERVPCGARPCHGKDLIYKDDPNFKNLVLFYEYFHGDTGKGLGGSHQCGWTALVALHLNQIGRFVKENPERFKFPSMKHSMEILRTASAKFIDTARLKLVRNNQKK